MMNGSSDMRDLEAAVAKGDPQAILTEQMYFYRIKKYIGAYLLLWVGSMLFCSQVVLVKIRRLAVPVFVKDWNSWV